MNKRQNLIHLRPSLHDPQKSIDFAGLTVRIFTFILSGALGYAYADMLFSEGGGRLLIVIFFLFLVSTLFSIFAQTTWKHRAGIVALQVVLLLLPFYIFPVLTLALAGVGAWSFFMWGEYSARRLIAKNMKIYFFDISRVYLAKYMTGLIFAGIVLYFPYWQGKDVLLSKETYDRLIVSTQGVTEKIIPGATLSRELGDYAQEYAQNQISKDSNLASLPPAKKNAIVAESANAMIQNIRNTFGVDVRADESIGDALYRVLISRLEMWRTQYGNFFFIGIALLIFLFMRSVGMFAVWIIAILSRIVYEILLAADILRIERFPVTQETIYYKTRQ